MSQKASIMQKLLYFLSFIIYCKRASKSAFPRRKILFLRTMNEQGNSLARSVLIQFYGEKIKNFQ